MLRGCAEVEAAVHLRERRDSRVAVQLHVGALAPPQHEKPVGELVLARALAADPKFILLDEPFAGVDPIAVEDIQQIVSQLRTKGIGILITDHNVQETLHITDRAYLLFEGHILKAGTAEELADDPQVRKVYLGQNFVLRSKLK